MTTADGIRKFGFKRWYERLLIESHVYLATGFLGMITAFAGLELIGQHDGLARTLLGVVAGAIGSTIVLYCLRRYFRLIVLAETLGDRAICRQCNTYGAFNIVDTQRPSQQTDYENDDSGTAWLKVKCRHCNHEWTL